MSLTDRDNYLRTTTFQGGEWIPTFVSISPACGCGSRQAINHPLNPELLGALLGPQALAGRFRKHYNGVHCVARWTAGRQLLGLPPLGYRPRTCQPRRQSSHRDWSRPRAQANRGNNHGE
jgi:hypothetical protein